MAKRQWVGAAALYRAGHAIHRESIAVRLVGVGRGHVGAQGHRIAWIDRIGCLRSVGQGNASQRGARDVYRVRGHILPAGIGSRERDGIIAGHGIGVGHTGPIGSAAVAKLPRKRDDAGAGGGAGQGHALADDGRDGRPAQSGIVDRVARAAAEPLDDALQHLLAVGRVVVVDGHPGGAEKDGLPGSAVLVHVQVVAAGRRCCERPPTPRRRR